MQIKFWHIHTRTHPLLLAPALCSLHVRWFANLLHHSVYTRSVRCECVCVTNLMNAIPDDAIDHRFYPGDKCISTKRNRKKQKTNTQSETDSRTHSFFTHLIRFVLFLDLLFFAVAAHKCVQSGRPIVACRAPVLFCGNAFLGIH